MNFARTIRTVFASILLAATLLGGSMVMPHQQASVGAESLCDTFGPLHQYLYATSPDPEWADAVICRESNWDTGATNPYSGSAGLAQFMWSTWIYGEERFGIYGSPYDGYAAIDMMNAFLRSGEYFHWACNGAYGCYDIASVR